MKELELPLTLNVVMHRANLDAVEEIIALAEELCADRLELANAQWQGFALQNREALMPSFAQLENAQRVALAAKKRLEGEMDVLFVKPDYFSEWPRACMDGWARRFIQVIPDGTVVPCHQATSITTLTFDKVTAQSLGDIWEHSPALNAFRGEDWMQEPCRVGRLRRLSLPSVRAHRRRGGDRSSVQALARPFTRDGRKVGAGQRSLRVPRPLKLSTDTARGYRRSSSPCCRRSCRATNAARSANRPGRNWCLGWRRTAVGRARSGARSRWCG